MSKRNKNNSDVGGKSAGKKKSKSKHRASSAKSGFVPMYVPVAGGFQTKAQGWKDSGALTLDFSTTGSVALVATIPVGGGVSERIGRKISWSSMQVRGYAIAGSTASYNLCSLVFFYDSKEPQADALPAITDLFESASSLALNKGTNMARFRTLYRLDFMLEGQVAGAAEETGQASRALDAWIDCKNKPAEYQNASTGTGAISDFAYGALYVVAIGNQTTGTAGASGVINIRTRFTDVMG